MKVIVKQLSGAELNVEVSTESDVLTLKTLISDQKEELSVERQRIIFAGKELQDYERLSTYGVQDGSICHLVTRPMQQNIPPPTYMVQPNE